MSDTNVGLGMVPFTLNCQCADCRIERLTIELTAERKLRETAEAELAAVKEDAEKFERRLQAIMPLFEEARDALTAIPLASAKLHGLRLDLGDRMDDVGDLEKWAAIDSARKS